MSDAIFVESLVAELNKAVGGGETALAEVNTLKPKVATLESKVATLENKPTAPSPSAYVTMSGKGTTFWWRQWSDGLIEQYIVTAPTRYTEVTFPKAFSNTNYFACAASTKDVRYSNGDITSDFYHVDYKKTTRAMFTCITNTGDGTIENVCIFACGY